MPDVDNNFGGLLGLDFRNDDPKNIENLDITN